MTEETSLLVVEDNAELARLYASWAPEEWSVTTVTSGEAADVAVDEVTDVVVLDRRLPGRSGDEVLRRLRDRGLDCQVVIVTAVEPDFDIVEMGFDDYLVKPVDRETFRGMLQRLRQRSVYVTELREYFAEVSKLAVLEARKTDDELEASDEYDQLCERVADRRQSADHTLNDLLADQSAHTHISGLLESTSQ